MLYKRPRFRRGGSTGIGSLTPRKKFEFGTTGFNYLEPGLQRELRIQNELKNKLKARPRPMQGPNPMQGPKIPRGFSPTEQRIKNFFRFSANPGVRGATLMGAPSNLMGVALASPFVAPPLLQATLPDELKGVGGLFDTYGSYGGGMGAGAETAGTDVDRILSGREKPSAKEVGEDDDSLDEGDSLSGIIEKIVPAKKEKKKELVEEDSFETKYEKEVNKLNKFIGRGKVDKGEVALLLADAIGTPGDVVDKSKRLNTLLRKKISKDKLTDQKLALLAYQAVTDLEKAEIMAGKKSFAERQFDSYRRLSEKTDRTANEERQLESIKTSLGIRTGVKANATEIGKLSDKILTDITAFDREPSADERIILRKSIQSQINNLLRIQGITLDNLEKFVPDANRFLKAEGGRVNLAVGGDTSGVTNAPAAPVDTKLDFSTLRNRLPKEITDDVVRLISLSEEALQDFAYIRTQGDVDTFNKKYGVSLVLPQETA